VSEALNLLLVALLLLGFWMLAASRLRALIQCAAAQGWLVGLAYLLMHGARSARAAALALGIVAIKGVLIPRILLRALRGQAVRRELEPLVSFTGSLLLGGAAAAVSVLFARTLPLREADGAALLVPTAFATVLTGAIVLTTRRKALTQIVGYLTLENGIFIFGLTLLEAMPFLVEAGVLLDVLVGVFAMGIVVEHIERGFSSFGAPSAAGGAGLDEEQGE
jgi:hydrogenase-4 component E